MQREIKAFRKKEKLKWKESMKKCVVKNIQKEKW